MQRRVILAIVLMLIVAVLPSILFPPKPLKRRAAVDSVAAPTQPVRPARAAPTPVSVCPTTTPADGPGDTVWVTSPAYRFGFTTVGAQLVRAELVDYKSFAPVDSGRPVQLVPAGRPLLAHCLIVGTDTISLAGWRFTPSTPVLSVAEDSVPLTLTAGRGGARVTLQYVFFPDEYRFRVRGVVSGLGPAGAVMLVGLGDGLRSVEADTIDDFKHFAVVAKAAKVQSTAFSSLKPGTVKLLDGPFAWAGLKSKYFLAVALAFEENQPRFGGGIAVGGPTTVTTSSFLGGRSPVATRAALALTLPVPPAGDFRYQIYAGPLEYRRLAQLGHDLDDANPYGGFMSGVIQPVSILVVNILIWMHDRLTLAYGWVLVIFGILVRVLLWPLNQKAMEASIRMQAVAPLIKDTQERYKSDSERLQREMLKIYKEHNVNPFGGCLPMLLPMPVLFALFFVFANTIEFRGVPFLWLPDLSRADPYYVIPVVMGLSMFVLTKVGQIGVPPNPQAKMLLYFMPIFMTVLFVNFASGLNLYYAVSNIFSIPQQYLIARRRLREQGRGSPPK
ncbi:MAG TPA: membrane protein insertase YidC [Gemmatimonadales bacterium]|nr:membrane protein insertase YidC [Gemmatimonadales bacterium]